MPLELIIKNTKIKEYRIHETSISNNSELSVLCQQDGKEESEIIQAPLDNIQVKYSSGIKEPKMRLETSSVGFKGWQRIFLFGQIVFEPLNIAYIEVPKGYKGILGKYADSG